jgi:hypothetical protein
MLENFWTVWTIGTGVVRTLSALRKDVESLRSGRAAALGHAAQLEALDQRTRQLELLAGDTDDRLEKIETSIKDAANATEALAQIAGTIFWMALAGCTLSVPALAVALVVLLRR